MKKYVTYLVQYFFLHFRRQLEFIPQIEGQLQHFQATHTETPWAGPPQYRLPIARIWNLVSITLRRFLKYKQAH